jgi:CO dehydrogenase/acetyl-CoA synthase alpha subunit
VPADDDDDEEEEEEEEEEGPAITPGLLAAQAWLSKLRLAQQVCGLACVCTRLKPMPCAQHAALLC